MASREERRTKREEKSETTEDEVKKKKKAVKKTASKLWSNYVEVIGTSKPLPTSDLPTLRDVLQQTLLLKESSDPHRPTLSIFQEVTVMVKNIWARANIRLVNSEARISDKAIAVKIGDNWECVIAQMKKKKGKKKKGQGGKGAAETFANRLDKLFSILHCRCSFVSCTNAQCKTVNCDQAHITCTCPMAKKVYINSAFCF